MNESCKTTDKLLALKVANNQSQLQIEVIDTRIYAPDLLKKTKTGHGLNLIKRIKQEDFKGNLHLNKNEWEGTSITIHIPIKNYTFQSQIGITVMMTFNLFGVIRAAD